MGCGVSYGANKNLVNKLLFPVPEPSSYASWSFKGELLWVPLAQYQLGEGLTHGPSDDYSFPCRLVQNPSARHLIIFFHKNADDLGSCQPFVDKLKVILNVHVLVVEYPGYGLSTDAPVGSEQLNKHAFAAVDFAQKTLRVSLKKIILMGSCVGTGPATAVAAQLPVAGLVLFSPFLSVVQVFKEHVGPASRFINEQFPNDVLIPKVRSPTVICHARNDKVVPFAHAEQLYNSALCKAKLLSTLEGDHHSSVEQEGTFLKPIAEFLGISALATNASNLRVPDFVFHRQREKDATLLAQEKQDYTRRISKESTNNSPVRGQPGNGEATCGGCTFELLRQLVGSRYKTLTK